MSYSKRLIDLDRLLADSKTRREGHCPNIGEIVKKHNYRLRGKVLADISKLYGVTAVLADFEFRIKLLNSYLKHGGLFRIPHKPAHMSHIYIKNAPRLLAELGRCPNEEEMLCLLDHVRDLEEDTAFLLIKQYPHLIFITECSHKLRKAVHNSMDVSDGRRLFYDSHKAVLTFLGATLTRRTGDIFVTGKILGFLLSWFTSCRCYCSSCCDRNQDNIISSL